MRGRPQLLQFAQNDAKRRQLAFVRLADDDATSQSGRMLRASMSEFDRAGEVDESQPVAQIIDGGDIGLDAGGGMGAGLGAAIADGRSRRAQSLAGTGRRRGRGDIRAGWSCRSGTDRRRQSAAARSHVCRTFRESLISSFLPTRGPAGAGVSQIFHALREKPMILPRGIGAS